MNRLLFAIAFLLVGGFLSLGASARVLAPLPDGLTPEQVRTSMATECAKGAQTEGCLKFSRLYYCRVDYDTHNCRVFRKHYWCNIEFDQHRCEYLTNYVREHGGASGGSSSSGSSSGADEDEQDDDPVDDGGHDGSDPICALTGTCHGTSSSSSSSGASSSSSSSTSSSSSSGSSTSSSGSSSTSSSTSSSSSSGGGRSGLPWMSGFSAGTGIGATATDRAREFGAWRGRGVDIIAIFIGKNSWQNSYEAYLTNEVFKPTGAVPVLKNAGIEILLTVPLVTKADAGKFAMVASGGIDAKHQAVADKIKSLIGNGRIYLRLGHEADEGYPWSYTGNGAANAVPAEYKAAWSRIARIYKNTLPGAKMVWNVLKNTRGKITDFYPGDDAVDILSIDIYDNGSGGYCNSATSTGWVNFCKGDYNPATGVSKGVNGILKFAKSRGKKIGVDEWGATNDDLAASNGANNSFFVQGMYDFFAANSAYIEYESYFNRAGGGRHQIWPKTTYNPLPSDSYLQKWRP